MLSAAWTRVAAAAGLAGTALAFWVSLAGGYSNHHGLLATARASAVFLPVAVGLHVWRRRPAQRYPVMLVLFGLAAAPIALAESHGSTAYSTGRVAAWIAEALLILAILLYPTGTFTRARDRAIAVATWLTLVLLYFPSALMIDAYPVPGAATTCTHDCPPNAFQLLGHEPAFVADVFAPLRETATVVLMLIVAAVMAGRLRSATHLARLTLAPVLVVAVAHAIALAALFSLRAADVRAAIVEPLAWLVFLSWPALALAVMAAEIRRRQFVATALERLAVGLPDHATAASLVRGMASSLEDPSLRIAFWPGEKVGHWVDDSGWPVEAPDTDAAGVTEIRAGSRRVAAILHDPWLADDPALLAAASSYALVVLENERLVADLRESLGELAESRSRVVAVADAERRRIERDLHDGAQQQLVGLRIQLELAAGRLRRLLPRESEVLMELGTSVDATIDEVRALATGVYPAVLAEQGLEEALRSAARRAPMATGVTAHGVRRCSEEVETTVYFACIEALQNAAKHAEGASGVAILLEGHDGRLRFEVRDDGSGFALDGGNGNGHGAGLVNMHDRVGAIGGELAVISSPGHGTRVVGSVPTG